LHEGNVIVNGKVRKDHKFPVGIFDILSIPLIKADYIVLLDKKGRLTVQKIEKKEADKKLCRVDDRRMIKGGKIQLNLHDGRNILLTDEISKEIKTHDSLIISLKDNKILHHYAYKKGNKAIVIGGKHSAQIGEIEEIRTLRSFEKNVVKMKSLSESNAQGFETIEDYVFVVGDDRVELQILR
jgi:small subunit ribosomal protein S4e